MVKRKYATYKLIPDVNIKNNQNISSGGEYLWIGLLQG